MIVSAVIVRDTSVLMVSGLDPATGERVWILPGGKVKPGELPHEALRREVTEETGLVVEDCGRLAWVVANGVWRDETWQEGMAMVFAVPDPGGQPAPSADERNVDVAVFVPIEEAIGTRLATLPARMRDPAIAYLDGTAEQGATWFYGTDSADIFAAALPPVPGHPNRSALPPR